MNEKPTPSDSLIEGKTQAELEEGYRAFRASLRRDYRLIKQRDYCDDWSKKEIGYHAHMPEKPKR